MVHPAAFLLTCSSNLANPANAGSFKNASALIVSPARHSCSETNPAITMPACAKSRSLQRCKHVPDRSSAWRCGVRIKNIQPNIGLARLGVRNARAVLEGASVQAIANARRDCPVGHGKQSGKLGPLCSVRSSVLLLRGSQAALDLMIE